MNNHWPGCLVEGCDFVVPADSKHPVNSLRTHQRHAHEGFPEVVASQSRQSLDARKARCEREFLALVEATGNWTNAAEVHAQLILWTHMPDRSQLKKLADDWEDRVEAGEQANPALVERMRMRLRALREYGVWRMADSYAIAGVELAEKAKENDLDFQKQVTVKYFADGAAMLVREAAVAFGTPKPTGTQIGKLVINAGAPPPKRLKAAKPVGEIIDAEVREIEVGNSGS